MLCLSVQAQFNSITSLSANDKRADAFLGGAVSVSGNLAVAGANGDNSWRGAVYVYQKPGSAWTFKQKLIINIYDVIKRIGIPEEKALYLDTSNVMVEKVPLISDQRYKSGITRIVPEVVH